MLRAYIREDVTLPDKKSKDYARYCFRYYIGADEDEDK